MIRRSGPVQKFLDDFTTDHYGRTQGEAEAKAVCVCCGKNIEDIPFKDELSRKEYKISGLCQACQDGIDWDIEEV